MAEVASPRRADAAALGNGAQLAEEESSAFECNICYEIAQSPVVTLCGHLYCWPCLYRCGSAVRHAQVALILSACALTGVQRAGGCRCRATAGCVLCARRASSRTRHALSPMGCRVPAALGHGQRA